MSNNKSIDLTGLENKIGELIEQYDQLLAENNELKQQQVELIADKKRAREHMETILSRLNTLEIPTDE